MAEGDQTAEASQVQGGAAVSSLPQSPNLAVDENGPLSPIQAELQMVTMERDDYRHRFETVEAELAALTSSSADADTIDKLLQDNDHLRKTLKKATEMLREKITSCNMQEKKNSALTQQVATLKDVLQVTRDLLNIRNMEVEQLQKNIDSMETRIDDNRKRQIALIKQMEHATKINGQLRTEYETQLQIFQSLKERYQEKVTALTNLANERLRHNSEESEMFEDAPDAEEVSGPSNVSEENVITVSEDKAENISEATPLKESTTSGL